MPSDPTDATYRGPTVPDAMGEAIRRVLGLAEAPSTLGDWIDALARVAERDGIALDADALCTTEESPHRATVDGESQHYACVQDPLVLPFLLDGAGPVTVQTESPESGDRITLTVTADRIETEPRGVVLSFGVDADLEGPDGRASPALAYRSFCPYGHAFVTRDEYERWADGVDAHTMAVPAAEVLEWARAIGAVLEGA